jgi:hypothetical protein
MKKEGVEAKSLLVIDVKEKAYWEQVYDYLGPALHGGSPCYLAYIPETQAEMDKLLRKVDQEYGIISEDIEIEPEKEEIKVMKLTKEEK